MPHELFFNLKIRLKQQIQASSLCESSKFWTVLPPILNCIRCMVGITPRLSSLYPYYNWKFPVQNVSSGRFSAPKTRLRRFSCISKEHLKGCFILSPEIMPVSLCTRKKTSPGSKSPRSLQFISNLSLKPRFIHILSLESVLCFWTIPVRCIVGIFHTLPRLVLEIRFSIIPPGLKVILSARKWSISGNARFNAHHKLLGFNENNGHVFSIFPFWTFGL